MIRVILLAVALVLAVNPAWGADGSIERDPLWRYSDSAAKQNVIVRDRDGRRQELWLNDPIFPNDQWIRFKKGQGKVGTVVRDPILDDRTIIFDDVGE